MRLLEVSSSKLREFPADRIPQYAILSHTWGDEEVLFEDISHGREYTKQASYRKMKFALKQSIRDGLEHLWIDNCCIDKTSSAELSEAINSMYAWYANAEVCYAYLSDVSADRPCDGGINSQFACSRWFTRGWTLQELLAPEKVIFFSQDWQEIGTKDELAEILSAITHIDEEYLLRGDDFGLSSASIAKRMSWAADRQTTRPEDIAYCLMGIFSVNMPLLYGEGDRAFLRLQEEIMRQSDNQSLFAWRNDNLCQPRFHGLLAQFPKAFSGSHNIMPYQVWESQQPYSMTNRGLRIDLPLTKVNNEPDLYIAALNCPMPPNYDDYSFIGIFLEKLSSGDQQYARVRINEFVKVEHRRNTNQTIYIRQSVTGTRDIKNGLFPHHEIMLYRGPSPNYRLVSVIPPVVTTTKRFVPPPIVQERKPDFFGEIEQQVWPCAPMNFRRRFSLSKARDQLAAALTFTISDSHEQFCVLLG